MMFLIKRLISFINNKLFYYDYFNIVIYIYLYINDIIIN